MESNPFEIESTKSWTDERKLLRKKQQNVDKNKMKCPVGLSKFTERAQGLVHEFVIFLWQLGLVAAINRHFFNHLHYILQKTYSDLGHDSLDMGSGALHL